MAELLATPEGPVSEISAAPFEAKLTENAPGPVRGFTMIGDKVPSPCTLKTSMSLVKRSITTRNLPSGLKANPPAPELFVERKRVELGIWLSLPWSSVNPTTSLLPPTLTTYTRFPCCATAFGSLPPEITLSTSDKFEPLTLNTETLPLPAFTANRSE